MPVVLDRQMRHAWLDGRTEDAAAEVLELTADSDAIASTLVTYEVGRELKNVRPAESRDLQLIEPSSES